MPTAALTARRAAVTGLLNPPVAALPPDTLIPSSVFVVASNNSFAPCKNKDALLAAEYVSPVNCPTKRLEYSAEVSLY